jgi:hypothetical protein
LGAYLGDGTISRAPRKNVWRLRIFMDSKYPSILDSCETAMAEVSAGMVGRFARMGCTEVSTYWKHWVCVFPQHGPGPKHLRRIALDPWQREVVVRYAKDFIKGLVHSDGCRATNRVTNGHSGERSKQYEYPRYFFSNRSAELRELFMWACSLIGVESRPNNRWNISVAKRESVAILDSFIGPKR